MDNKIEQNVLDFMKECSGDIGDFENDLANVDMWRMCTDYIKSPIERVLYCALYKVRHLNLIGNAEPRISYEGKSYQQGITIDPQYEIDKYRVDFLITYYSADLENDTFIQNKKEVIVECDSQQFHDRTEEERRYEKCRDRYLQSKGYKVFRFTGSEIVKNPLQIAQGIISFLTEIAISDLQIDL